MKKRISCTIAALTAVSALAGDNLGIDPKYGKFSGRVQTLSMWRDYEKDAKSTPGLQPDSNYSHSLGLQLDYLSPEFSGFLVGGSYIGVGVLDAGDSNGANPGEAMVLNGRVNVLNEGYLQYRLADLNASNTVFVVGRQADNGEVFRYTEPRQKKRSLEGLFAETKDIPNTRIKVGHTWKLSNIYGSDGINPGLSGSFDNYADVFNYSTDATAATDTDGVTWFEAVYSGIQNLEVSLFNAYAWDVANVIGTRAKFNLCDVTAIEGFYRNERDVGAGFDQNADAFSLALIQKLGGVTLEGGYFGVHGGNGRLRFEENTTGFNHALGLSMLVDTEHFQGGADTFFLKAVTKINKTTLYGLFAATWHKKMSNFNHGQELDLVVKQQLTDSLSVALKGAVGQRQITNSDDQTQMDGRVFITYKF